MAHYYFENTPHGKRKDGSKLDTGKHYDYISREADYANMKNRQEDLKLTSFGNLPDWADTPRDFWQKAEEYRNKPNGRAYREFKFALQEELSFEENIQCIEKFLKETGIKDNHAYSYAVHDKPAAFAKEHRNIHCHLMFNEKIIEKDRPLAADMYFKNYAQNKLGEPVKGYRSSREFSTTASTVKLRKLYADIVNDKFREKGLNISISEKSLKAQRQELLEQGKVEEAELLNRMPAPHLGDAYKNPAVMERIMTEIDETDAKADEAADGFMEQEKDEDLSIQELKIKLFANDVVIRQVARQLQQERARLKKEQQAEKARIEAEELQHEAMVITTGDVCEYLDTKITEFDKKAAEKLAAFKAAQKNVLDDKRLELLAKDKMFDGNYSKDMRQYSTINKELNRVKIVLPTLYGQKDKLQELAALSRKNNELTKKRNEIGKRIGSYKTELTNNTERYNAILSKLKKQNEEAIIKNKALYSRYKYDMLQTQKYKSVQKKLSKEQADTILFSEKIASQLGHKNKLNGTTFIKDLPFAVNNNNIYFFTEQKNNIVKAVKIGDDIVKGKVPVYYLKVENANIKSVSKSDEMACLYARKNRTVSMKNLHPIMQEAYKKRHQSVADKVAKIANNLVNDNMQQVKAKWQENEQTTDKTKLAEKKMYNEWSL
ncbi:MAG: MobA/MobL family protein [Firmicutes bacterium]|nr:MobA/MobL family protein [Candidatus Alectryobacillus merdavium]